MYSVEFLKNNPIFWSRLGFAYDPPLYNERGKPLVFSEDFSPFVGYHKDFLNAGIKVHTSILHLGWMDVDEYDYSLTDRTVEAVFSTGENVLYIPRIKLNAPIGWCRENPAELFVYHGGPRDEESIRALVGTEKQDYFGYEAPDGYYRSGEYVDPRPNVGGLIARQSLSSEKWRRDAGVALLKLIEHLESSEYADRIIGYHIAYGISGESVTWGRIDKRYGDEGISNRRAFLDYGIRKYGSLESCRSAWHLDTLDEQTVPIPTLEQRLDTKTTDSLFRSKPELRSEIDYDVFASEANADSLEYFARLIKEKTSKLVGAFYGYLLFISNPAYSAHLALDRLLDSPYIDFLAAPKSYSRCLAGESGGELCPAQSINLKKLFVDELDNRTFLAVENAEDIKSGFVSADIRDSLTVMWREVAKDLSHNSGFWWMDLGGGWFNDSRIMNEVSRLVEVSKTVREKPYESASDVLILFDERSFAHSNESTDLHRGFLRELIGEMTLTGALADVYRAADLGDIDLSRYRLIILAQNAYMDKSTEKIITSLPDSVTVRFLYRTALWGEDGYSTDRSERITGYTLTETGRKTEYDLPELSATKNIHYRPSFGVMTEPYPKASELRSLAASSGCKLYTDGAGSAVYGDKRFISVFTNDAPTTVNLPERGNWRDLKRGELYLNTDRIVTSKERHSMLFLVRE